jgi:hypothetical protein
MGSAGNGIFAWRLAIRVARSREFHWRVFMKATVALVGLVATLLAACGSDGEAIGIASHGSIRGIVTDSTGATLSNVAVALTGNGEAARSTNTGAGGVYTFAGVPPGTYTLAVTPPPGFTIGTAGTASVTVAGGTALLLDGKVMMGQSVVQYAYGFMNRVQVGRRLVGHGGSAPGMSGELSFEPNGGYTVVVLSNFSPPAAALIEHFILNSMPNQQASPRPTCLTRPGNMTIMWS